MKNITRSVALLFCSWLLAAPLAASQAAKSRRATSTAAPASASPPVKDSAQAQPAGRSIQYTDRDVVPVRTKVRYTTLIVLPKDEAILDFVCGDGDLWIVNGDQNFAYVKPAKENSQTNLNLITASGNVYSFVLNEISGVSGAEPDLKIFVEAKDLAMTEAASGPRRFVPARELDDYKRQAEKAKEEAKQAHDASHAAIEAGINRFVTNVRFAYRLEVGRKPFYVRAMYHDDNFTYIQARPEETPTLYEIKDGKPNLVDFDYNNGVYVVPKVLDRGYLAIGKRKLEFRREE